MLIFGMFHILEKNRTQFNPITFVKKIPQNSSQIASLINVQNVVLDTDIEQKVIPGVPVDRWGWFSEVFKETARFFFAMGE